MLSTLNAAKSLFFLSFLTLLYAFKMSFDKNSLMLIEWEIMSSQSFSLNIPILLDVQGLIFSSTVLFISANIMWFSTSYMNSEMNLSRFTMLVLLFVASMNLLIYIPNLLCLLIGWDGLGLVSFILVIYYQNHKSCAAGMITVLTNRIGDVMLIISIAWTFSLDSWSLFYINMYNTNYILWLTVLLAAMTKSAQLPFSAWLPAAMAAPTPVSALVHSSTLVTAGVFLLLRFSPFLYSSPGFNQSLLIVASGTMLMAGMIAMSEMDMKKIIALSTLSQLGVMMFSLSLFLPQLTFAHLVTHALFKALLFVCAGNLIHISSHSQDLRLFGNNSTQLPVTSSCMLTANMALCAIPFMAGFYSKDMIIETSFFINANILIFSMLLLATFFTVAYSIRLTKFVYLTPTLLSSPSSMSSDTENFMAKPMLALSIGAIMSGSIIIWNFSPLPQTPILPSSLKLLPLLITATALLHSTSTTNMLSTKLSSLYKHFSSSMWFLNFSSTQFMMKHPQHMSFMNLSMSDQGWTELMGPNGLNLTLTKFSGSYQPFQNNPFNPQLLMSIMSVGTMWALLS